MRPIGLVVCVLACLAAGGVLATGTDLPAAIAAAVDRQVARLHSPDPAERVAAAREIALMGEQAAAAVPALTELLADPARVTVDGEGQPAGVSSAAAWALSDLGPAGTDALLRALDDPRTHVKVVAARALGGLRKDRRAISPLIELAQDADPQARIAALGALADFSHEAAMGPGALGEDQARVEATLRKAFADPVWRVREQAAMGFMSRNDTGALAVLTSALRDSDPTVRADAANSLALFGDQRAVEPLLSALKDPDPSARSAAAVAVGRLKGSLSERKQPEPWNPRAARWQDPDPRVVQALTALLEDPSPRVRAEAAKALGETRHPRALQPLIAATEDDSSEVAAEAYSALGWLGSSRAVPALVGGLKHGDPEVRVMAAQGLSILRLGLHDDAPFRAAVKPLLAALQDSSPEVRSVVAMVLGELRDRRAVTPLRNRLRRDPDPGVRASAASALAHLGGAETTAWLIAALDDTSAPVRAAAARALAGRKPDAPTTAALVRALQDPDPKVRLEAASSLAQRSDPRATEALKAALQDPDRSVRERAAEALARSATPEAAAPSLENLSPHVRSTAADTLIRQGGPAAVEALLTALRDPNERVRMSALASAFHPEYGRGIKDPRLVEPLIGALEDSSPSVRMWAVFGLAEQADARAVEPLIKALSEAEPEFKVWVAGVLYALTGQELGEDALAWQRWWEENEGKPLHPSASGE